MRWCLVASCFVLIWCSVAEAASLEWVKAGQGEKLDVFNVGLEPAGIEGTSYLYVARVQPDPSNSRRVPGKLKVDYRFIAFVSDEEITDYNKFEVLVAPPGSTSWLASSEKNLPENAIVGGELPDGSPAYICRALHSTGNVIVGKYFGEEGYCKYPYGK